MDSLPKEARENGRSLYIFANREKAPELEMILTTFYRGCHSCTVGVMQALNSETGEEEVLLVGVAPAEDGEAPEAFPLARVLKVEEANKYKVPDGKGGWVGHEDGPVAE